MNFLKKSKDLDDLRASKDNDDETEEEVPEKKKASTPAEKIQRLEMEIETLKAQIDSVKEVSKESNERFSRINEQIGELRTYGTEREKKMRDIELKSEKAASLVEEVHPETLLAELKKESATVGAIKAKVESHDMISSKIISDLKEIRSKMSTFRGTDEILSLNKEVHGEIISIKKIEATVEKHADRVEAIYSSFEKNFEAFEKAKDDVKALSDAVGALRKDVEKNRAIIEAIPKKEEFYNVKKEVEKMVESIGKEKSVYDSRNKSVENDVSELLKKTGKLEEHLKSFGESVKDVEKKTAKNAHRIDSILAVIEKMMDLRERS